MVQVKDMTRSTSRLISFLAVVLAVVALLGLSLHRMDPALSGSETEISLHVMHGDSSEPGDASEPMSAACTFHCVVAHPLTDAAMATTRAASRSDLVEPSRWLAGRSPLPLGPPPKPAVLA